MSRPNQAVDLAVFRIVVFALLLSSPDVWTAVRYAGLPRALQVPPLGWGWAAAHLPMDAVSARLAQGVLLAAGSCALAGFFTRASAALAALAALYLLGIPQLMGTVRHYHHLVWFATLLAASPSGDALSLDALLGARRGRPIAPRPPIAYALPLRFAWVLVACVYFFPGLWKWRAAGWQWALSDNLRNQMRWKWLQYNWLPPVRVDRWPGLCRAAALATMIFEVGFPLALPFRRLRAAAVTTAIGFHLATAALMRISFPSLWLTYVMFVPWRRAPSAPPYGRARLAPTVIVGALLLAGAAWAGLRGAVQAWPFACYPTFQWMAPDEMPALEVDLVGADGQVRTLGPRWSDPDPQRSWGQTWSLVLSPDGRALESFLRLHSSAPFSEARFYRVYLDVDPDRWSQPPRARTLIQRTTQTVRDPVTPANPDAKR